MLQGKTVLVDVLEDHTYDGEPHKVGEQYEAEEGHVEFLTLRGYARPAPEAAPEPEPEASPDPEAPVKRTRKR